MTGQYLQQGWKWRFFVTIHVEIETVGRAVSEEKTIF
jgi:macrodomain Ter protein organizer (MatP/YcbG family)